MAVTMWITFGLAVATPAGAQQAAAPAGTAAADAAETGTTNQASLSATADQTARIRQDRDAYAASLATFQRSQARYAHDVAEFEEAKRAVAQKTADDAAAYARRMDDWRRANAAKLVVKKPEPVRVAASATATSRPRTICTNETPTGTMMPIRRCRTVTQIDADADNARRDLDAKRQSDGAGLANR